VPLVLGPSVKPRQIKLPSSGIQIPPVDASPIITDLPEAWRYSV